MAFQQSAVFSAVSYISSTYGFHILGSRFSEGRWGKAWPPPSHLCQKETVVLWRDTRRQPHCLKQRIQEPAPSSVQLLSLTLCDPMDWSTPGLHVHHQLPEFTQTPVHWIGDAIQASHPLVSPFPPALNLSQHQGLYKWVTSSHQVAKVLEFQLQHQFLQWTLRTDLL